MLTTFDPAIVAPSAPARRVSAADTTPSIRATVALTCENGLASAATTKPRSRLALIDEARGLLLSWMICSHSMTLAALPLTHPLQYTRPPGWASPSFVILTGFAIALLHASPRGVSRDTERRLFRRALQIGLVAIVSNIAFLLAKHLVGGSLTAHVAFDIATFQVPWSISAVLIPTALVVGLAPVILRWPWARRGPILLAGAIAALLLLQLVAQGSPDSWREAQWFRSLIAEGQTAQISPAYLGFAVVNFTVFGLFGFGLGALARAARRSIWVHVGAIAIGILVIQNVVSMASPLVVGSRLALVLAAVSTAGLVPWLRLPRAVLALLGRAALLVFVLHRVIVQTSALVLGHRLPAGTLAATLMVMTLVSCAIVAYVRDNHAGVKLQLSRVGL